MTARRRMGDLLADFSREHGGFVPHALCFQQMPAGFVKNHAAKTVGLDRPDNPADEKDRGHREGQIQIRVGATEQRLIDMESARLRIMMTPADGPDSGKKAEPI